MVEKADSFNPFLDIQAAFPNMVKEHLLHNSGLMTTPQAQWNSTTEQPKAAPSPCLSTPPTMQT